MFDLFVSPGQVRNRLFEADATNGSPYPRRDSGGLALLLPRATNRVSFLRGALHELG